MNLIFLKVGKMYRNKNDAKHLEVFQISKGIIKHPRVWLDGQWNFKEDHRDEGSSYRRGKKIR